MTSKKPLINPPKQNPPLPPANKPAVGLKEWVAATLAIAIVGMALIPPVNKPKMTGNTPPINPPKPNPPPPPANKPKMTDNTPPINPAKPNSPALPANKPADGLKEWVAAALAIAIVGMTLILLWNMFFVPTGVDPTFWQHQSSVMQICLTLAGTVTGYYFGRIPAERAAASANRASEVNALRATEAIATQNKTFGQLKELKAQLQPGGSPMGGGGRQNHTPDEVRAAVARRIEQIIDGG